MGCLGAPEAWGPWARAQRAQRAQLAHWIRRPCLTGGAAAQQLSGLDSRISEVR